jgi:hypothetical protein
VFCSTCAVVTVGPQLEEWHPLGEWGRVSTDASGPATTAAGHHYRWGARRADGLSTDTARATREVADPERADGCNY